MKGFVVIGTDTDAGKTAFCLLALTAFADRFAYWKPIETGASDSERVRRLVPSAVVHPPMARFEEAVAPLLAARREGQSLPGVSEIDPYTLCVPDPAIIETFGGPFSPLNEESLQIELLDKLGMPLILVTSSAVGAIGRILQSLQALAGYNLRPTRIVLIGPEDPFALEQIQRYGSDIPVVGIETPSSEWTTESLQQSANTQRQKLASIFEIPAFESKSSQAKALILRDRQVVWHPYTSLGDPDDPLSVASVEAEYLHLTDGRTLIDGISSWWTIQHGHRHPPLMAALREAQRKWDHVLFAGVTHEPGVQLAELLLSSMPWEGGRVFYSDNGSTAVEVALKMAYQAWCHRGQPRRTLFVGFENGYHGDTFGAMAAGRDPLFFGRFEPLLFRTLQVPVSAEKLDAILEAHPGEVAAVILEPLVQGAGGMRMHSPEELKAIFEVAKRHGVFFIADEVMTGGSRTGSLWAFQQAGISPDLVCAAKTLTGGILPLAATLVCPEIVAEFETADRTRTFFHGHSFTANPLACSVAVANWRGLLDRPEVCPPIRIEEFWKESLLPLAKWPGVRDLRIRGTIAAIEFDYSGGYLADLGRHLRQVCIQEGVFLRPLGNVLYAMPPYCIGTDSMERIASVFRRCCESAK